jgi:8-oxo-dGTP pyrophosphatase MutT (NUDIX family)
MLGQLKANDTTMQESEEMKQFREQQVAAARFRVGYIIHVYLECIFVCIYMCVYVCIHTYIYIHKHVYIRFIYRDMSVCECMYWFTYRRLACIYVHAWMYVRPADRGMTFNCGQTGREGVNEQLELTAKEAFQRQYTNMEDRRGGVLGSVLLICRDAHCSDADKVRKFAAENSLDSTSIERAPGCSSLLPLSTTEEKFDIVVLIMNDSDLVDYQDEIVALRKCQPTAFCIVRDDDVSSSARDRMNCFRLGAHMIANDVRSIADAFFRVSKHISELSSDGQAFECPFCKAPPMSLASLASHLPMYHGARNASAMTPQQCMLPKCGRRSAAIAGRCSHFESDSFTVHVHFHASNSDRPPIQGDLCNNLTGFAHVICRRPQDKRFLLVHESAELCDSAVTKYWWPAGRLDPGENFEQAAVRETEEEGGVKIRVVGVLEIRIQVSKRRFDVILLAEPVPTEGQDDVAACKSVPDFESVGAMWVDVSELEHLKESDFRDPRPLEMFPLVSSGEMRAHSYETQSFRQLEELMSTWTARMLKEGDCERDLWSVSNALRREYGPDVVFVCIHTQTHKRGDRGGGGGKGRFRVGYHIIHVYLEYIFVCVYTCVCTYTHMHIYTHTCVHKVYISRHVCM